MRLSNSAAAPIELRADLPLAHRGSRRNGHPRPKSQGRASDCFGSKPATRLAGKRKSKCGLTDAEPAVAAFVPADKQDEILMPLRLDRALLELFAVRRRNTTAHSTAKAKYGLS
jgi:hypothetical protein